MYGYLRLWLFVSVLPTLSHCYYVEATDGRHCTNGYLRFISGRQSCDSPNACTDGSGYPRPCVGTGTDSEIGMTASITPLSSYPPRIEIDVKAYASKLRSGAIFGLEVVNNMSNLERLLYRLGMKVKLGTPSAKHLSLFSREEVFQQIGRTALAGIIAVKSAGMRDLLSSLSSRMTLADTESVLSSVCPVTPACNVANLYRNYDGTCNNLDNPLTGAMGTTFTRLIDPAYDDGLFIERRRSVLGSLLPSPRLISARLFPTLDRPALHLSLLTMQWGQFLDHDFSRTPVFRGAEGVGIQCCQDGQQILGEMRHPQCLPIIIPDRDPFYSRFGQKCMEFVRSLPGVRNDCSLGYADQINSLTHYLDGSMVYGSNTKEAEELRSHRGGRLKEGSTFTTSRLLPPSSDRVEECPNIPTGLFCFKAGDERVNEQIDLSVMHTIWMREHNRICSVLQSMNPGWGDERIYQESRRIVIAQIQHITYNEWLPIILGQEFAVREELLIPYDGYSFKYNSGINPSISASFSTAAFRFGHTLIQGHLDLVSSFGLEDRVEMHNHFNPYLMFRNHSMELLVRGLMSQPMQAFDPFFADDIRNKLFQMNGLFGLDLTALNIMRGRDHGLPGYNAFRQLCGFPRATSFNDLRDHIQPQFLKGLAEVYRSVEDIDLFVGGSMESPAGAAVIGPVFRCIVADQFKRLKFGDRYFFDLGDRSHSFTPGQLVEIKKSSISRVICDNTDGIYETQKAGFVKPSSFNPVLPCSGIGIPIVDLRQWRAPGNFF